MDQWARRQAGTLGDEAPIVRGNRRELLGSALAPLRGRLDGQTFDRLAQALSLIFGTEAFVVLKDIWGLDGERGRAMWRSGRRTPWSGPRLARGSPARREPPRQTKKNAAAEPRKRRD